MSESESKPKPEPKPKLKSKLKPAGQEWVPGPKNIPPCPIPPSPISEDHQMPPPELPGTSNASHSGISKIRPKPIGGSDDKGSGKDSGKD